MQSQNCSRDNRERTLIELYCVHHRRTKALMYASQNNIRVKTII
uniref:Uncharacterized protein n=1 Tax=Anguilla anguilla TaxID=7936 RepID=A0A0E9XM40_ANGAN